MTCPMCDSVVEFDEEELSEGDTLACDECGSELRVVSLNPVELEALEEEEEDDDEDDDDEFEEEEEDEDEEDDDWR